MLRTSFLRWPKYELRDTYSVDVVASAGCGVTAPLLGVVLGPGPSAVADLGASHLSAVVIDCAAGVAVVVIVRVNWVW